MAKETDWAAARYDTMKRYPMLRLTVVGEVLLEKDGRPGQKNMQTGGVLPRTPQ